MSGEKKNKKKEKGRAYYTRIKGERVGKLKRKYFKNCEKIK